MTCLRAVVLIATLLVLALAATSQAYPAPAYYYTTASAGIATEYNDWQPGGGCGYINNPGPGYQGLYTTAGTSQVNFGNGELCGMCVQVTSITPATGNPVPFINPPYTVMINNFGPTPSDFWLDHSVSSISGGRFNVRYQAVPCPVVSPVQWQLSGGSSTWYLQLIPVYNSLVITQMCIALNGVWQPMSRVGGGNGLWMMNGQQIPNNPTVKAISVDGQVIVDTIGVTLSSGVPATAIYGGFSPKQFADVNYANLGGSWDCNLGGLVAPNDTSPSGASGTDNNTKPSGNNPEDDSDAEKFSPGAVAGLVIGSFFGGVLAMLAVAAIVLLAVFAVIKGRRAAARRGKVTQSGRYVPFQDTSL
eukprot:TRINITY_DN1015_c0_g2_i1.p1 TRINITY_DN1015_c0_g2~~TRINITY_DN1015_c0_g2_i1.p1  ORF type:complete len:361 (+),score=55.86 TRINITY_DN1015_c0_g2_i1:78-1160(+)